MKKLIIFTLLPFFSFADHMITDHDCGIIYTDNPKSYAQYRIRNLDNLINHYSDDYIIKNNQPCFIKYCEGSKAAYEDMIIFIDQCSAKHD